jgi:hypothetical protein
MFLETHHFPEFTLKCQDHYSPNQRAIISSSSETLFTITPESIDQMLKIPISDFAIPFSIESLNDLYQKLTFPQRAQIFEIFLPEDAQLPKKNPPYSSSIFTINANHIISILFYLLGYFSNELVDEPILGFLSIFSIEERATIKFNFSQFLDDNIHDNILRFPTEGMFRYSSVLVYMFFFFLSVRQVSMCISEIKPRRKPTISDLMDLIGEGKFNIIHLQEIHRPILLPNFLHAK